MRKVPGSFYGGSALAALMVAMLADAALAQSAQTEPQQLQQPLQQRTEDEKDDEIAPADGVTETGTDEGEGEVEEVVVTGEVPGQVKSDIPPEVTLSTADVRAYGVSSIADLLNELTPQTGSARGRGGGQPVILLNGRRISSFREIRDVPTEAIERVDILPEEVALKYGYRADQRVVNFVLRRRFRAITAEAEAGVPTRGGNAEGEIEASLVRIARDKRINLKAEVSANSGLLESERDIIPTGSSGLFDPRGNIAGLNGGEIDPALSALAGTTVITAGVPASAASGAPTLASFAGTANQPYTPDATPYRTLISPSKQLEVNGVYSQNLSEKISGSINLSVEAANRTSLLGLNSTTLTIPGTNPFSPFTNDVQLFRAFDGIGPLERTTDTLNLHAGFSVNGDGMPFSRQWRWSLTGNYDRDTSKNVTDVGVDPAAAQALIDAGSTSFNPFAPLPASLLNLRTPDTARSTSNVGDITALTNGPLFRLPAGDVSTSIRAQFRTSDFDSRSVRSGVVRTGDIGRDSGSIQANLDLPIASRRRDVLSAIGDLSLNGNVEVEKLSDFGTLVTTGYGVNWSPLKEVRLIASVTDEEGAPSANQLGDPVLTTPNVRVFDYVRGQAVAVTTITGGNPGLEADSRHVLKLGLNLRPFEKTDLQMRADYVSSTTRNQISGFPAATAEVEAAFPGRFVRDTAGNLLSVDNRSVNFDRAEREELRWGFNLSLPLKSNLQKRIEEARARREREREEAERNGTPLPPEQPWRGRRGQGAESGPPQGAPGQGGAPAGQAGGQDTPNPPGAAPGGPGGPGGGFGPGGGRGFGGGGRGFGGGGGGFGGGGGGGGGGAGAAGGRIQVSVYHTWRFKDQITIRQGLPVLDLLNGSASGNNGGSPEHQIEANGGVSRDGMGFRIITRWQSGTEVRTGVLGSGDELNFGSLATVNLRLFADLGQQRSLVRDNPWLRGARVTLSVNNLFNQRQRVTDELGVVPLSYQPGLIDPTGRSVRLQFRKLFF